ncbi:reduced viability upon starvation protein [Ascobolus immersus RN42]|uniref:Reduced viability upon starvation protein n=1 Tax=Ascobolus immersus RN42 TaxID=1160509 RepID=A0A3N4IPU9_ASCIM|nr:reduced viability upon starvation protein [Ascobolus immersus RN42]
MSWKGFSRSVVRAPQSIKQKFNIGETTKDLVYIDAERRFEQLEKETKNLHDQSKKYFESINSMLQHQIGFSQAITEIYKPISGRPSDPETFKSEGNVEGIQACEDFEAVVVELQSTLAPELELIETRIIRPADELMEVIKAIRKLAVKRDHKQLDYDRHRTTLKKLQDKKDKTLKDEKALYKAENETEMATQEYNYYNDLLKDELPKLFALEQEFIKPLFQSFYYMQLNVFYTLHERMDRMNINYFDMTTDIEAGFIAKRGDIQEQAEALPLVHFKTVGNKKAQMRFQSKFTKEKEANAALPGVNRPAITVNGEEGTNSPPPPTYQAAIKEPPVNLSSRPSFSPVSATAEKTPINYAALPPPPKPAQFQAKPVSSTLHTPPTSQAMGRSNSTGSDFSSAAKLKKKPAPPPPKPKPKTLAMQSVPTATALYDFEAQAEGDLTFAAGDVIEIVQKTPNENEWWTGKLRGVVGQFPGNYVRLN